MFDAECCLKMLTEICEHYEKTAPTVHAWADDLFIRINEQPDKVVLSEILFLDRWRSCEQWTPPNLAANEVYHLLHRLGRDVCGQSGY
jgi:hypothetical protein